ncbi:D-alanyl-D-alanine carboxypeptidase [Clostridium sp. chh4-2]|uniref:D-alanyl-D-alanine carboxypeptidase family protein n=1 Tax=Clostridium sp. chh4-2 TaxID=2067550 RepID=UPI000CCEC12D|nr:D-alanyl-D-alanine carboxypeptidase family protein [Clostridium sp. chh4-2]PNV61081.1 D-alanyl-D-alanine carboxypeptidase [Clostridium sp. chh4-2]
MIRKITVFLIVIIMMMVQTAAFTSYGEEEEGKKEDFNLYSQSAVLIDGDSGRILYGKNEEQQRPMASTTKIMTCILALEHGSLDDVVTASSNAAAQPKVHLSVRNGEEFYLKDLLYSLMLESHNDSAVMIAEHIGGSVEGFAAMMNQKARDLGCNDSFFITPNGLDAKVSMEGQEKMHSTSAADLSRIMKYCVMDSPKKEEFLEITRTQNYYFTDVGGKRSFNCVNHNALLSMMDSALSGKTGFTGGAGYSYVGAVRKDDRTFVIALLGCGWPPHKTYKWSDARTLFQYGLDNYRYKDVFEEVDLKPVTVSMGISENGDISQDPACKLSLLLKPEEKELRVLMNDQEHVEVSCRIPKNLKAPVYANTPVGSVTYSLNGENIKVYPVYACSTIEKINFKWCLNKITNSLLSGITCPQF